MGAYNIRVQRARQRIAMEPKRPLGAAAFKWGRLRTAATTVLRAIDYAAEYVSSGRTLESVRRSLLGLNGGKIAAAKADYASSTRVPRKLLPALVRALNPKKPHIFPGVQREDHFDMWCMMKYGPNLEKTYGGGCDLYRGYAQIDIEQIPDAVRIINDMARDRERDSRPTHFKFLIARIYHDPKYQMCEVMSGKLYGRYDGTNGGDAVIAFYGDTLDTIIEIMQALAERPDWRRIEEERISKNRRPGTNAYIVRMDGREHEFRTLGYNRHPGHSKDLVRSHGEDGWRDEVDGEMTEMVR